MKEIEIKTLLVNLLLFAAIMTIAQPGQDMSEFPLHSPKQVDVQQYTNSEMLTTIFSEDFSGGFPPTGWEIVGGGDENWVWRPTNNAGGEAPEISFGWGPPYFNGISRLVTAEISTSGYSALELEFKHYVWDYAGSGYSYKVETTSDGGATWNEVWSISPTGDIEPEIITLVIDNEDVGSDNFQLALTFDGNTTQINYWYLDDIILSSGSGTGYDVTYMVKDEEANPVEGAVVNMQNGGAKITDATGQAVFTNVLPGTYTWDVSAAGLATQYGEVTITDADVTIEVVMSVSSELLSEHFAGGTFPPEGWSKFGDGQTNWNRINSDYAGGEYPEICFNGTPDFTGSSKFVSPALATSGNNALFLEFKFALADSMASGYSIKVESTSDGGATWNEAWSVSPTEDIGPTDQTVLIATDDVGSDEFQFAFTFEGNSAQIDAWYIDDVRLITARAYDAAIVSVEVPALSLSGVDIDPAATVTNLGYETVTFDVKFEIIEDDVIYSEFVTVTNMEPLHIETVTFPAWTTVLGNYNLRVTANLTDDENTSNDTLMATLGVTTGLVNKKPLYEMFTSSTCPPCVAANEVLDSILLNNPDQFSIIKYQMNWPGAGDPYYTEECGARGNYYGVVSVPDLYINSEQNSPPVYFTQETFDAYHEIETALEIDITEALIDLDNSVSISVNLEPIVDYAQGLKAYIVVTEKLTEDNVGSNGETEFHHVMMKMLPDESGTTLDVLVGGETTTLTETFDMNLTNMETPDDLSVVVFVQDDSDKSIVQSDMADISLATGIVNLNNNANSLQIFPNPAKDQVSIRVSGQGSNVLSAIVFDLNGKKVLEQEFVNQATLNVGTLEAGVYALKVYSYNNFSKVEKLIIK